MHIQNARRLSGRVGYEYHADTAARNIAYYDQRTSHGSTLSFITHAGVSFTGMGWCHGECRQIALPVAVDAEPPH